jgi:hypothetical protein
MVNYRQALQEIENKGHRFFVVIFQRKRVGKNGEPVGSERRMLCRRHVRGYVKGVLAPGQRAAEDSRCKVLTVFDVSVFNRNRKTMPIMLAGERSYRRINMTRVVAISPFI